MRSINASWWVTSKKVPSGYVNVEVDVIVDVDVDFDGDGDVDNPL